MLYYLKNWRGSKWPAWFINSTGYALEGLYVSFYEKNEKPYLKDQYDQKIVCTRYLDDQSQIAKLDVVVIQRVISNFLPEQFNQTLVKLIEKSIDL